MMPKDKAAAVAIFQVWIDQDPGLDPRDYGIDTTILASKHDLAAKKSFEDEKYDIKCQRKAALEALEEFRGLEYDPVVLEAVMSSTFSSRLSFDDKGELDYCVGQYWPTEYRKAAAVCLRAYNDKMRPRITDYPVTTMHQLKKRNAHNGYHFFEESTMCFFNSVVETPLLPGGFFVTSERQEEDMPKKYTIRRADVFVGSVDSTSDFQEFDTLAEAKAKIKEQQKELLAAKTV